MARNSLLNGRKSARSRVEARNVAASRENAAFDSRASGVVATREGMFGEDLLARQRPARKIGVEMEGATGLERRKARTAVLGRAKSEKRGRGAGGRVGTMRCRARDYEWSANIGRPIMRGQFSLPRSFSPSALAVQTSSRSLRRYFQSRNHRGTARNWSENHAVGSRTAHRKEVRAS